MSGKVCGLYFVHGIPNMPLAKVEHVENIDMDTQITDHTIKTIAIKDNLKLMINKCRITNAYLVSSKTLPVFSAVVTYETAVMKLLIYKLTLSFTIKGNVTTSVELLDRNINGSFSLDMTLDGKTINLSKYNTYPDDDAIIEEITNFINQEDNLKLADEIVSLAVIKMVGDDIPSNYKIPKVTKFLSDYKNN